MEHKHESVKLGKSQGEKKTAFVVLFSAAASPKVRKKQRLSYSFRLQQWFWRFSSDFFLIQWLCLPMASTWGHMFWQ